MIYEYKIDGRIITVTDKEIENWKSWGTTSEINKRITYQYRTFRGFLWKNQRIIRKHIYLKLHPSGARVKFWDDMKYVWRSYWRTKRYFSLTKNKLEVEMPFVFYPLQNEPEVSMGMMAPEFNEQLALISLIAKNLPAGILLVVKEHIPAIGVRPRDFYSTIISIPNVVMVSPYISGIDVIKKAEITITISGTAGMEAAVMGKSVISFGIHNDYNFLDHVHVVKGWVELRPLLNKLLCKKDTTKKKRKMDGIKYLAMLKSVSFHCRSKR